jgi:hypothetical protein
MTEQAETIFRYYINKKKPAPFFEGRLQKHRCPHIIRSGQQCRRFSVIGWEECQQHMKMDKHLIVKRSHIPKAGLGVFADGGANADGVVFPKDTAICDYEGEDIDAHTLYERYLQYTAPYAIRLNDHTYIDGALKRGIGTMVNASESRESANVEFVDNTEENKIEIHAKEDIKNGDELVAYYGPTYRLYGEPVHFSTRRYNKTIRPRQQPSRPPPPRQSPTKKNAQVKSNTEQVSNTIPTDELIPEQDIQGLISKNVPVKEIQNLFSKDRDGKSKLTPIKRLKKISELIDKYNPPPPPPPPKPKSQAAIEQKNYFIQALNAGVPKGEINELLSTGIRRDHIRHFLMTHLELRMRNRNAYKKQLIEFKTGRFNPNYKEPEENYYKNLIKEGITMQEINDLLNKRIDKSYIKSFFENNMKLFKSNKNAFQRKKEQFVIDFAER